MIWNNFLFIFILSEENHSPKMVFFYLSIFGDLFFLSPRLFCIRRFVIQLIRTICSARNMINRFFICMMIFRTRISFDRKLVHPPIVERLKCLIIVKNIIRNALFNARRGFKPFNIKRIALKHINFTIVFTSLQLACSIQ